MSVHLFVRSSYTLLKSTVRIMDLVHTAKEMGYTSVALTDHNVMYGVPSFLDACKKENIHPIVGMEVEVFYHEQFVPFLLLAANNNGYKNLMKLSSLINSGKDSYCSIDQLKQYSTDCFLIVYGEGGWADAELVQDKRKEIFQKFKQMKEELPRFDVALSYQEASLWKERNAVLKRICSVLSIRTCALNKIFYMRKEDADAYRVLMAIDKNMLLTDASLPNIKGRYFLSPKEMENLYEKDDLQRTEEIATFCTANFQLPLSGLPHCHVKNNENAETYLPKLCYAGLQKRLHGKISEKYVSRLKYELNLILKMHFADYFLIVYDFIRFARKRGIYIGPGRGSAAGSLCAYCLGITMIDPLQYDLLFERFLNPERVTMPDIDTDIPDCRREEVIRYVYDTYGSEHVCSIITFGTLAPRQVIRDTGKVMGFPQSEIDRLVKLIPSKAKITLAKAYQESPRLKQILNAETKYQKLFRMASRLEGLPRHTSIHAAGIVLSSLPLEEVIPTVQLNPGMVTSQFSKEYLEERGLIKMDFLGLKNLSIIDEIVQEIRKSDSSFNILNIAMNDSDTYQLFARGDTVGIFQFESDSMKSLLRRMKPRNLEDLACAMALYRPGAMMYINTYLECRKDPSKAVYPSQTLKPFLEETYGIMVYQEQVMLCAEKAAGFSLGKADLLRRAMSKKDPATMRMYRNDFVQGCLHNGYTEQTAEDLFNRIEQFAGYGFNKSHAMAYSTIAYQMAWLKTKYPAAFYTSLLNGVIGDSVKMAQYIDECRQRKIQVCNPNVNVSERVCIHDMTSITLSLDCVVGIGALTADVILKEREQKGKYKDYYDFIARCVGNHISKANMQALIDAGALDSFKFNRSTMRNELDNTIRYAELIICPAGDSFYIEESLLSKPMVIHLTENDTERSEREREALGFTLGPSPIIKIKQMYHINVPSLAVIQQMHGRVKGCAFIRNVRQHRTKKGDMMAFMILSDETSILEMRVMPRQFAQYGVELVRGAYIVFEAKMMEEGYLMADSFLFLRKKV